MDWLKTVEHIENISPVNIIYLILGLFIFIVLVLFVLALITVKRGNTFHLWGLKIEPNSSINEMKNAINDLTKAIQELNAESKQKAQWLKLQLRLNKDILYISSGINDNLNRKIKDLIQSSILPTVISIVTEGKHNVVRAAILIPEGQVLRIFSGSGYSREGTDNLRLSIDGTVAGKAFSLKETQYIPDVTNSLEWSRNPKSSKDYCSLCCIPICINDHCFGILNIDGDLPDCFTKDSIKSLELLASSLAVVFYIGGKITTAEEAIV